MFEKIKRYYDKGIYKKMHIIALVQSGNLTTDDYVQIVGEEFPSGISTGANN